MENIEIFDRCTALIFAKVYESFPVPFELEPKRLAMEIQHQSTNPDDVFRKGWHLTTVMEHTIQWLGKAGYLNLGGMTSGPIYNDVTLTPKGLETMKAVPSSLAAGEDLAPNEHTPKPAGERIVAAVREGAIDVAVSSTKLAITESFKQLTKGG